MDGHHSAYPETHVIFHMSSWFLYSCTHGLHADKTLSEHTWVCASVLLWHQGAPILYVHFCSVKINGSRIHKNECNKDSMNVNVNSTGMIAQGAGQEHEADLYRQDELSAGRRHSSSSPLTRLSLTKTLGPIADISVLVSP